MSQVTFRGVEIFYYLDSSNGIHDCINVSKLMDFYMLKYIHCIVCKLYLSEGCFK